MSVRTSVAVVFSVAVRTARVDGAGPWIIYMAGNFARVGSRYRNRRQKWKAFYLLFAIILEFLIG